MSICKVLIQLTIRGENQKVTPEQLVSGSMFANLRLTVGEMEGPKQICIYEIMMRYDRFMVLGHDGHVQVPTSGPISYASVPKTDLLI